jgi:hypothetical protein
VRMNFILGTTAPVTIEDDDSNESDQVDEDYDKFHVV